MRYNSIINLGVFIVFSLIVTALILNYYSYHDLCGLSVLFALIIGISIYAFDKFYRKYVN